MGSQGTKISHIMFADDLLLFGEETERQIQCVMETLQKICSLIGVIPSNFPYPYHSF